LERALLPQNLQRQNPTGRQRNPKSLQNYIAKATKQIKAPWCVSVFEDNAGIVKFDKGLRHRG
jgi:hypothetical protein